MSLGSQEYPGQEEVDKRLYQSRLQYLDNDSCLFLPHASSHKAPVVAAVCNRLEAFSFRMKSVW